MLEQNRTRNRIAIGLVVLGLLVAMCGFWVATSRPGDVPTLRDVLYSLLALSSVLLFMVKRARR